MVRYEPGLLLGKSKLASALASMGLTFLIDVGFEGYGAITSTGRWGNPYWTIRQKRAQAFLVIGSDVALAGILALTGVAWYIAVPVALAWAIFSEEYVFTQIPGTSQFYKEHYNLMPLD